MMLGSPRSRVSDRSGPAETALDAGSVHEGAPRRVRRETPNPIRTIKCSVELARNFFHCGEESGGGDWQ